MESIIKRGRKLRIRSKISRVQPMKFGNKWTLSCRTFRVYDFLPLRGLKYIHFCRLSPGRLYRIIPVLAPKGFTVFFVLTRCHYNVVLKQILSQYLIDGHETDNIDLASRIPYSTKYDQFPVVVTLLENTTFCPWKVWKHEFSFLENDRTVILNISIFVCVYHISLNHYASVCW